MNQSITNQSRSYPTIEHEATVLSLKRLNEDNYLLELQAEELVVAAEPGQFVDLAVGRFLRRPLGIAAVDKENGSFSVGFLVKGEGTAALSELITGETLRVLGPLGQGFRLEGKSNILVIGGGTGVYPLLYLLDELAERKIKTATAFGFRSKEHFVLEEECRAVCAHVAYAAESGSSGIPGNALDAAEAVLAASRLFDDVDPAACAILSCGPVPMLRAVAAFAKERGIDCQVSLEERMACGIGYCRTCSCKAKTGEGPDDWNYERVCIEGPVFPAERVFSE